MSSFATSGTASRDASSIASVVFPAPGAPPITTSFGFSAGPSRVAVYVRAVPASSLAAPRSSLTLGPCVVVRCAARM